MHPRRIKNSRIQQAPTHNTTMKRTSSSSSSSSRRFAIPSTVEIIKGRQDFFSPLDVTSSTTEPSAPIPIAKKCYHNNLYYREYVEEDLLHRNAQEEEEAENSSAHHYDWATWRMYARITNARRMRAFARLGEEQQRAGTCSPLASSHQQQPYNVMQPSDIVLPREEMMMLHAFAPVQVPRMPRDYNPSSPDESIDEDDGVFTLDDLEDY